MRFRARLCSELASEVLVAQLSERAAWPGWCRPLAPFPTQDALEGSGREPGETPMSVIKGEGQTRRVLPSAELAPPVTCSLQTPGSCHHLTLGWSPALSQLLAFLRFLSPMYEGGFSPPGVGTSPHFSPQSCRGERKPPSQNKPRVCFLPFFLWSVLANPHSPQADDLTRSLSPLPL